VKNPSLRVIIAQLAAIRALTKLVRSRERTPLSNQLKSSSWFKLDALPFLGRNLKL
jgi:hypothetical protein